MKTFDEKPITPWPLGLCVVIQAAVFLAVGGGLIFVLKLASRLARQLV